MKRTVDRNLVVRADGSMELGHGHIFRTLVLADELCRRGWRVTYVCSDMQGLPLSRIKTTGLDVVLLDAALSEREDAKKTISIASNFDASWLVVDRYSTATESFCEFGKAGLKTLAIDDICEHPFPVNILVNQNMNADSYGYQTLSTTKKLLGTRYTLLRPSYISARPTSPPRIAKVGRILVFMGGGDNEDATGKLLLALNRLTCKYSIDVVVGSAYGHGSKLKKIALDGDHEVSIYQDLPDLVGVMKTADVFICAGGSVTWEACCLGLPLIGVPIADNQMGIAETLHANGAMKMLGRVESLSIKQLATMINKTIGDVETLNKYGENGWRLVDGSGVKRIIESIEQYED